MSPPPDSILHSIRMQKTALIVRNKQPTELHIGSEKLKALRLEMHGVAESVMREMPSLHRSIMLATLDDWPEKIMGLEIVEDREHPLRLAVE